MVLCTMSALDAYAYPIPEDLIAHAPINPRDAARLLVVDTTRGTVTCAHVRDLPMLVPHACVVYNDTTVVPARLNAERGDGTPIELLMLVDQGIGPDGSVRALVNMRVSVGEMLRVHGASFMVLENHEKSMLLRYQGTPEELSHLLVAVGQTPLPPYIRSHADETTRRREYQSMFASRDPSVAAPTASLHFTPELVQRMTEVDVTWVPVTLQVGLGTFAPVFDENFTSRRLHRERYCIPRETAATIVHMKAHGRPVLALGTTVLRTLESGAALIRDGVGGVGETDLFIFPPYHFAVADMLLTNFHVPRSSLLCLVQAFLEHKGVSRHITDLYRYAIAERFRLYSYGDAMLVA